MQLDKLFVVGEAVDTSFFAPLLVEEDKSSRIHLEIDIDTVLDSTIDIQASQPIQSWSQVEFQRSLRTARGILTAYDSSLRQIFSTPHDNDEKENVVFLFVGKWEARKGIDMLVVSFLREFYLSCVPAINENESYNILYGNNTDCGTNQSFLRTDFGRAKLLIVTGLSNLDSPAATLERTTLHQTFNNNSLI